MSAGKTSEAIDLLRQAVGQSPDLAEARNHLAWQLVSAAEPLRNVPEAVAHARRATELVPDEAMYLNTYGVALYRAGRFAEAVPALGKSLEVGQGENAAFDLFFLAMAHHRLAHREEARGCFDRAVRWVAAQKNLSVSYAEELDRFRAEAESVLATPADDLPADVFADTGKAVAVLRSQTLTWLVNQNAAHRLGRGGEEVPPAVPLLGVIHIDKPDVGLMNERRGPECLGPASPEPAWPRPACAARHRPAAGVAGPPWGRRARRRKGYGSRRSSTRLSMAAPAAPPAPTRAALLGGVRSRPACIQGPLDSSLTGSPWKG